MLIKEYLKKKYWSVSESYSSDQMKSVEKILKIFENIDINTKEKLLHARLQDPNTVVILSASTPCIIRHDKPPFILIVRSQT